MPRRRRAKRPFRDYLIAAFLFALLAFLSFSVVNLFQKEERAREAAKEAKAQLASLKEREAVLSASIAELSTDRGQEASLRETYGVARPGEEVIIVIAPEEGEKLGELPWWRRFLGFFGL